MSVVLLNQSIAGVTDAVMEVTFVAAMLALFILSATHGPANFDMLQHVLSWAVAFVEPS